MYAAPRTLIVGRRSRRRRSPRTMADNLAVGSFCLRRTRKISKSSARTATKFYVPKSTISRWRSKRSTPRVPEHRKFRPSGPGPFGDVHINAADRLSSQTKAAARQWEVRGDDPDRGRPMTSPEEIRGDRRVGATRCGRSQARTGSWRPAALYKRPSPVEMSHLLSFSFARSCRALAAILLLATSCSSRGPSDHGSRPTDGA